MSEITDRIRAAGSDDIPDVPAGIDEASIRALVHGFYGRIREDAVLGPVFSGEIAPDAWPVHLQKMCDFWSSVLLRTHRYAGRPLPPHLRLPGLSGEHFGRWLGLFRLTAEETMPAPAAAVVVDRAERIAHSFQLAIAFHRGEDTVRLRPQRASDFHR